MSDGARPEWDVADVSAEAEALVAFFAALPAAAHREYELLAELDRRFGEDALAERRAHPTTAEKP